MKVGIMQPYFFPYLGYFSLIRATERWVVFDEVQFIRHGWIERNRVLNSSDGWQYIKVPLVKSSRDVKIKDTLVRNEENWQNTILAQLTCYKRKAPYYNAVTGLLMDLFNERYDNITSLNVKAMEAVCSYLGLEFNYQVYSRSGMDVRDKVSAPGDWALQIAKELGADEYINPYGGQELFDRTRYEKEGIKIRFLKNELRPYNQRRGTFEPGLSILDTLMFNSPEETVNLIDAYLLID
jgi:hypothetical protein